MSLSITTSSSTLSLSESLILNTSSLPNTLTANDNNTGDSSVSSTTSTSALSLSTNPLPYEKNPFYAKVSKIAYKIGLFLQQNWHIILLYILIWTIIIVCYGAMYGFETVGLPLAIGLGVGFGIGIISGIVVALTIDKKNKWAGKNTLWSLVTHYMWDLDEYGTRQILIATIITVVSAAFTASPYAIGGIIGLLLGNHILTKICYHLREVPTPMSLEQQQLLEKEKQDKIDKLQNQLKIEILIRNQLLLKKELANLKKTPTSVAKTTISSGPRKKRVIAKKKRIISNKNKSTSSKNKQALLLQNQLKTSANKINSLKSHLLQPDEKLP